MYQFNRLGLKNTQTILNAQTKKSGNLLYATRIYLIYIVLLGWVLWHINHCRLFNAEYLLYIYIKSI